MATKTHIDITLDLGKFGGGQYDLRIPIYQTVTQLMDNLADTLKMKAPREAKAIRISTKALVLTGEDRLVDYPVTDGDVLVLLKQAHLKFAVLDGEREAIK